MKQYKILKDDFCRILHKITSANSYIIPSKFVVEKSNPNRKMRIYSDKFYIINNIWRFLKK